MLDGSETFLTLDHTSSVDMPSKGDIREGQSYADLDKLPHL